MPAWGGFCEAGEVGDDFVTRSRHPSPRIHSATRATAHFYSAQLHHHPPPPPLAIIEWGRRFDGKGGFAAFAHFTASPSIGLLLFHNFKITILDEAFVIVIFHNFKISFFREKKLQMYVPELVFPDKSEHHAVRSVLSTLWSYHRSGSRVTI